MQIAWMPLSSDQCDSRQSESVWDATREKGIKDVGFALSLLVMMSISVFSAVFKLAKRAFS